MNKKTRIIIWILLIILVIVFIIICFQENSTNKIGPNPQANKEQENKSHKVSEPSKEKTFTIEDSKQKETHNSNTSSSLQILNLELPKPKKGEKIIKHLAYVLSYNEKYHQANWVAYLLTRAELVKNCKRSNDFQSDPKIPQTDFSDDYYKSGFDRGHLAPAADMSFSKEAMEESFFYTNMSPQLPSFNRGIWKKLEEQVRDWAQMYDSLYIVTGPMFADSMDVIGNDKIVVPVGYYKALLQKRKGNWTAIGFLLPNTGSKSSYQSFALSIDSLEEKLGFDFFYLLEDEVENEVERNVEIGEW